MRSWRLAAAAAVLAGVTGIGLTTALAQDAAEGGGRRHGVGRAGGRQERWKRFRAAAGRRAQARHDLMQALAFTDAQMRTMLEKARAAQPLAAEARRELARIAVEAEALRAAAAGQPAADRAAARQALRAKVQALRAATAEKLAPLAKDVLATFTAEQRARLEGFAAAHGRKLDEAALVRRIGRRLARPMTVDLLEARLATK